MEYIVLDENGTAVYGPTNNFSEANRVALQHQGWSVRQINESGEIRV